MNIEDTPLHKDGNPMLRFEVKIRKREDDTIEKAIFIDEELLDWAIDISSLMEAKRMGPQFFKEAQKDIEKHFIESVSDTIGRKVTVQEIKKATVTGWI